MPTHGLVQRGVGLHGVLAQAEEIVGGTILDGQRLVVAVEVRVLAAEVGVVELCQAAHLLVLVFPIDAAHVLVEGECLGTASRSGVGGGGGAAIDDDLMTLRAVQRFYTQIVAGVSAESGECPGGFDGCLSHAAVEEHPAVHVVVAVALVGQFYLTLVEDGGQQPCTVAGDAGGKAVVVVCRVAHAAADLLQGVDSLVEMPCAAGCLGEVEQHLGVAHGEQRGGAFHKALRVALAVDILIEWRVVQIEVVAALAHIEGVAAGLVGGLCEQVGPVTGGGGGFRQVVLVVVPHVAPQFVVAAGRIDVGGYDARERRVGEAYTALAPLPLHAGEGEGAVEAWVAVEPELPLVIGDAALAGLQSVGHGEEVHQLRRGSVTAAAVGVARTDAVLPTVVLAVVGLARHVVLRVVEGGENGLGDAAVAADVVCPLAGPVGTVVLATIAGVGKSEATFVQLGKSLLVGGVGLFPAGEVVGTVEDGAGPVEAHLAEKGLCQTGSDASEILRLVCPAGGEHRGGFLQVLADEVDAVLGGLPRDDEVGAVAVLAQDGVLHLVDDGHATVDGHQVVVHVGAEEIGLAEEHGFLLVGE